MAHIRKKISGYVRVEDNQDPVVGASVTVYYEGNGQVVPTGGVAHADANPVSTNSSGYFEWTTDLDPGPVYIESEVGGVLSRVRSGREIMQAGSMWVSDLGYLATDYSNGFFPDDVPVVTASASSNEVTVQPFSGVLAGRRVGITQPVTITLDPNPSLAVRKTMLGITQEAVGTAIGRQNIELSYGTSSGVYTSDGFGTKNFLVLAQISTNQGSGTSTIEFPANSRAINRGIPRATSTTEQAKVFKAATDGGAASFQTLSLGELLDVTGIGASLGFSLVRGVSQWQVSDAKTLIAIGSDTGPVTKFLTGGSSGEGVANYGAKTSDITLDNEKTYDVFTGTTCVFDYVNAGFGEGDVVFTSVGPIITLRSGQTHNRPSGPVTDYTDLSGTVKGTPLQITIRVNGYASDFSPQLTLTAYSWGRHDPYTSPNTNDTVWSSRPVINVKGNSLARLLTSNSFIVAIPRG
jgi:hypothetical protein